MSGAALLMRARHRVMPPASPIALSVLGGFVMQGTQEQDGSAALVSGRPALARCVVQADSANTLSPTVTVELRNASNEVVATRTLTRTGDGVPLAPNYAVRGDAYEVELAGSDIVSGLQVVFQASHTQSDPATLRWPRGTTTVASTVRNVPTRHVTFVPVETNDGRVGTITEATAAACVARMKHEWPLQDCTWSIRAPYVSSAGPLQSNDGNNAWLTVLSQMSTLRTADGAASTNYYCGVLNPNYGSGIAGYAYTPGRASTVWDKTGTIGQVFSHELGHNFSVRHSEGCGSGNIDAGAQGTLAGVGWRRDTNAWFGPGTNDIMNYCSNQWVSRFSWNKAATYLEGINP